MPIRTRKPKRRVNTTRARYKTGAKSQSTQIIKLQKQVDKIKIKTKDLMLRANFQDHGTIIMSTGQQPGGAQQARISLHVRELLRPPQLTPIFTTTDAFDANNKVRVKRLQLIMDLTILPPTNQETTPVYPRFITIWIVSLKKETGKQLLSKSNNMNESNFNGLANGYATFYNTTGDLRSTPSLTNRRGQYFLNPDIFNIRKVKRCIMGNAFVQTPALVEPGYPTNLAAYAKRLKLTLPMNNVIQSGGGGTAWKAMTPAQMNTQDRSWMIVECEGYSTDTDITDSTDEQKIQLNYQTIWTLTGSQ
jgi:hypothetical protein